MALKHGDTIVILEQHLMANLRKPNPPLKALGACSNFAGSFLAAAKAAARISKFCSTV